MPASRPPRERFGRAQRLALFGGAAQVLAALLQIIPLPPEATMLQLVSGVAGLCCASSHHAARCYGAALVLVYGGLLIGDLEVGPQALVRLATLQEGRAAVLGLLIAMVPVRPAARVGRAA